MRRILLAAMLVFALLAQPASIAIGAVAFKASNKAQATDFSRTLVTVYIHHMKAVDTKGKTTASTSDEKKEDAVARDFINSIYKENSEHIWFDLMPKNQRGGAAALLAVDVTGGQPEATSASSDSQRDDAAPFNKNVYHGIKTNKDDRKAMARGFKEALSDISKSGKIDQTGVANDGNAGFVAIKFKDGRDYFLVPIVKDGKDWKVDLNAFWVITDPSVMLKSAYDAGKDMKSHGDKKGAKELLGDLLPLEGVYGRLTEKPYSEAMQPEIVNAINAEKPTFNEIRNDYNQVK